MSVNTFTIDLLSEPRDETYRQIVDLGVRACDQALLVIRDSLDLEEEGAKLLESLERFFLRRVDHATQWPGTTLLSTKLFPNNTARLYYFRLCDGSAQVLKDSADGLYSWRQPERPEDLCLLRENGSPWLVSIAHEEDSCLHVTSEEEKQLGAEIPYLHYVVRPSGR